MKDIKSPQINWNELKVHKDLGKIIDKELNNRRFYFVHSYRFRYESLDGYLAYCDYGEKFLAAYHKNNIYGTQFHPEKSQTNGLIILKNFFEVQ